MTDTRKDRTEERDARLARIRASREGRAFGPEQTIQVKDLQAGDWVLRSLRWEGVGWDRRGSFGVISPAAQVSPDKAGRRVSRVAPSEEETNSTDQPYEVSLAGVPGAYLMPGSQQVVVRREQASQ